MIYFYMSKYKSQDGICAVRSCRWTVYDLPAIVRAGQVLAEKQGLTGLDFIERIEDSGAARLFLGSGLMQYLDMLLSLSHVIDTHPELGRSESAGFYFRLG